MILRRTGADRIRPAVDTGVEFQAGITELRTTRAARAKGLNIS